MHLHSSRKWGRMPAKFRDSCSDSILSTEPDGYYRCLDCTQRLNSQIVAIVNGRVTLSIPFLDRAEVLGRIQQSEKSKVATRLSTERSTSDTPWSVHLQFAVLCMVFVYPMREVV